jgi:antitoxin (DNA-binding transcriptional repressor) of toxin-antitoxin stability system
MGHERVSIGDLEAHLGVYLRKVRLGQTLTVLDGETPVARIVPYEAEGALEVRRAVRRPHLRLPAQPEQPTDSLTVLFDDRAER